MVYNSRHASIRELIEIVAERLLRYNISNT